MQAQKKPKGDSYYRHRAANYNKRRTRQDWWHVEQAEMLHLLRELPKGLSVLDVPFGTGRFVPYYNELGYSISGLDASHDMLAAAKAALGPLFDECTCVTGDAAKMPYVDGQFDLVVSTRFLRDIVVFADAKRALAEMARVTSKYAIIQLGENPDVNQTPADDEVMGSLMTPKHVNRLLASVGLTAKQRRLVKKSPDNSEIYHIFCEKS